jgi:hypothetical protein
VDLKLLFTAFYAFIILYHTGRKDANALTWLKSKDSRVLASQIGAYADVLAAISKGDGAYADALAGRHAPRSLSAHRPQRQGIAKLTHYAPRFHLVDA